MKNFKRHVFRKRDKGKNKTKSLESISKKLKIKFIKD